MARLSRSHCRQILSHHAQAQGIPPEGGTRGKWDKLCLTVPRQGGEYDQPGGTPGGVQPGSKCSEGGAQRHSHHTERKAGTLAGHVVYYTIMYTIP